MRCYRIVRPQWAKSALSGEGARLYGGRWNSSGRRCVYAAESRSLAILELLVHLVGPARGTEWSLLTIELPDESVPSPSHLLDGWDAMPAGSSSQFVGDAWLASEAALALRVPSVVVPEESNLLINPDAAGFDSVEIVEQRTFQLDLRLADQS